MILNTMLLVNETSVWTSSADIADSINKIIAQNDCFNGGVLSDQDEIVYESGDITKDFENITSYADSSTIACKNVKSDTGYFIQLCGAINVGSKPMYLNVGYDITSVYQQRNEQQRAYVITFITMIVLGAAFSYILSYLMTKPLVELKNVASEISEGNYEVRSLVNSNDEIGLLAKQINNMTETLIPFFKMYYDTEISIFETRSNCYSIKLKDRNENIIVLNITFHNELFSIVIDSSNNV